jgi:hypothetical protein
MVRTCFIEAPQCGHLRAVRSGLGMAGKVFGRAQNQYSARCDIDKVNAIARATGDALIGLRLVGGLEPMVDAQTGRGAAIHDGNHSISLTPVCRPTL